MTATISTIGYEGENAAAFLNTLVAAGISHVIDIRDVPASRKPGFSKRSLSDALAAIGISYTHLKPLGDPKPGREAMRSGNYPLFLEIYNDHIALPAGQQALGEAIQIAQNEPSVLLCFERKPEHCHRTLVAREMKGLASFQVRHIGVNKPAPAGGDVRHGSVDAAAHTNG